MNKANLLLIVGLAGGAVLGFLASGSVGGVGLGVSGTSPDQSAMHDAHDHDRLQEVSSDAVPAVAINLLSEGGCAYNMQLDLTNFRFAPEAVNGSHIEGEGHAHLYADGQKLARVYSEWFHFSAPKGAGEIEITLNSNDHAILALQGAPITATAQLTDC